MNIDVVVIGAGPAGLAAAITLARTGRSVVVLDRSSSPGSPFGETFPPAILSAISQLGILSQFDRCPRLKCIGVIAAWGSSEPYVQDHIVQPYGHGWHVDRSAFNSQLLQAAQQHGVLARLGVGRIQIVRESTGWAVNQSIHARFLIDASGRSMSVRLPGEQPPHIVDHLAASVQRWRARQVESVGAALVETAPQGWCYCAPLPGGQFITAFHCDPPVVRGPQSFKNLPLTRELLAGATPLGPQHIVSARSIRRGVCAGEAWAAAGDAAVAWDPLSGQGVTRALRSGIAVANATGAWLDGQREAFSEYMARHESGFENYLRQRRTSYSMETRWAAHPFWRARRARAAESA